MKLRRKVKSEIKRSIRYIFKSAPYKPFNPFPPVTHRISKKFATLLVLTIFGLGLFKGVFEDKPTAIQDNQVYTSASIECIDGDTFRLDGNKIRLLAIDTPESVHPTKPVEEFGLIASDYTCNALQNAEEISLKYDEGNTVDKYDRYLYWVYIDDVLLQEALLSEGYAEIKYVDNKTVDKTILQALKNAQNKAQIEQLGIWKP